MQLLILQQTKAFYTLTYTELFRMIYKLVFLVSTKKSKIDIAVLSKYYK